MTVDRRQHYDSAGEPKKPYTKAGAAQVARSRGGTIKPYRCEVCGRYHVGHRRTRDPKKKSS